ncbi:uncharacterized protein PV06_10097 [Exophiala oligosperma]|uniref:tRNA (guanine(10)-N(2))-methyltransferase n=1 Tax=Exophiala oligosperma TaxID=215243 RepID=A0A0D2BL91_9EURO|nr:uncharacterized protein PV06_10097 [Exophiala oligosperma]KIW38137.1 hypothetical protein PV06_10097 [Exophiala oligosperma]
MDYLIRFAQTHESFRRPEIEALSRLADLECEIMSYSEDSPFCVIRFQNILPKTNPATSSGSDDAVDMTDSKVRDFISKSILAKSIYEVWGQGQTYENVHKDVKRRSQHLWSKFQNVTFRFSIDTYGMTHDAADQKKMIDSFSYLDFKGKIRMKNPQAEFALMEEWSLPSSLYTSNNAQSGPAANILVDTKPNQIFLGRKIGESRRWLREKHDLKKRPYISTTSMDAELALLTANMALATPGKIFLDPFVGTGGFMVAAAELGAMTLGSDIDGRSFRGKGLGLDKGVGANFNRYGISHLFGDCITSDLTNTPFRSPRGSQQPFGTRWLDGIICDPPYGVREGLKVLGTRKASAFSPANPDGGGDQHEVSTSSPVPHMIDGVSAHTRPGYIAPKRPYSFNRMLDDILDFAARTLVDRGRLAFWMPSANENESGEEESTLIPTHPQLELKHECIQRFNKWSRRLLVYERLPGALDTDVDVEALRRGMEGMSGTADELNPFRKRYFESFVGTNGT